MKKILFILIAAFLNLYISAQSTTPDVISASGDHYSNGQGSISWTLGEISTETYTSANNGLTQGFQQPRLMLVGVNEETNSAKVNVYPNPVKDLLLVDLQNLQAGTYSLELYDASGKLVSKTLQTKNNTPQLITVGMKELANGTYYLNVVNATANYKVSYRINKAE